MIEFNEAIKFRAKQLINQIVKEQQVLENETQNICNDLNENVDSLAKIDCFNADSIELQQMESIELENLKDKLNELRKTIDLNKQKLNQIDTHFVLINEENNENIIGRISLPLVSTSDQQQQQNSLAYNSFQHHVEMLNPNKLSSPEQSIPTLNPVENNEATSNQSLTIFNDSTTE